MGSEFLESRLNMSKRVIAVEIAGLIVAFSGFAADAGDKTADENSSTMSRGTHCGSLYQDLSKRAEEHPVPGPKTYRLYRMSEAKDSFGQPIEPLAAFIESDGKTARLVPQPGNINLNDMSLAEAQGIWGQGQITTQNTYVNSFGFQQPTDKVWKWFASTNGAYFARFPLTSSDKSWITIEAFFITANSPAERTRLAKYRVVVEGVGNSGWIDI